MVKRREWRSTPGGGEGVAGGWGAGEAIVIGLFNGECEPARLDADSIDGDGVRSCWIKDVD